MAYDPRAGLHDEEPAALRTVGAPPPRTNVVTTPPPTPITSRVSAANPQYDAAPARLPGVRRPAGQQLVCQVTGETKAKFERLRQADETNGDALVRMLGALHQQLVEHFADLGPEEVGGGFVSEVRVRRSPHRSEPMRRMAFQVSTQNARALRTLLDDCGLGDNYSPLVERAINLLDAKVSTAKG